MINMTCCSLQIPPSMHVVNEFVLMMQVRGRIEGNSATVKKQAEGKRVFNVPNHGFVMRKCPSKASGKSCMHHAPQTALVNARSTCSIVGKKLDLSTCCRSSVG